MPRLRFRPFWGEPRFTRFLDVALLTGFGGEAAFVDAVLTAYPPRFPDAGKFALERRILLVQSQSGVPIDISLSGLPYEEETINRSIPVEMLPGRLIRLCTPEDLVVMKMFAGRPIDLNDVSTVVVRSGKSMDWPYVESRLLDFAEIMEDPTLLDRLQRIRQSVQ